MDATDAEATLTKIDQYEHSIRELLRDHNEVASKSLLQRHTDVPAWYIDQIASSDQFYTSLTHNGRFVANKHIVGHRCDHNGSGDPRWHPTNRLFSTGKNRPKPR